MEDTITATYSYDSVTLPTPVGLEDGSSSFGGWFYDKECTSPAGKAGDKITPNSNLTLYAKRVELLLKSVNNMNPYGGSGAVNLSWNQNDGFEKTYLLYQSTDNKGWKRIYGASDLAETKNVNLSFNWNDNGKKEGTYIIPYTGFYTLTAFGAQGGNYGANRGGYGGQAEGKIWLTKGEKVTYTLGGQNGYNGGGRGNMFSNGGGCTVITTDKKGTILIAGGGGGATSLGNGYNGGSTARNLSTGYNGENGEAGGGGGYKGGKAGEHIVHNHTEDCYFTTSLDYTLLNNATQYISPWMQNFYDNFPWIRSGGHTKTNTIWRVRAHTVSNKENAQYYLGVYDNGTKKTYAPTNGNKEVYISAYMECTGGNDPFTETTFLEVYNQDDELLYRKNADEIPQYYNEAQALEASICNYGNNSGKVYFYKNYTDTNYFYWNETIPLSSKDTGIRVSLQLEVNGHNYPGCWYHISLNEISFRGGIQKHPKCGYTDNQVISSAPAFGGSNYANPKYFTNQASYIGTKANNGSFAITSNQIGFEDLLYLNEVKATDLAPPTQVVLPKDAKTDLGNNQVKVVWDESRDNGTVYYHKAESYEKSTSTKLSTSNTTRNELISGIKGYYYLVDNSGGTTVSTANGTFTPHTFATVTVTNYTQYLHICAVDLAGNISPTTHIPIGLEDSEIAWNIFTDKIQISSLKDSIYLSNRTDTYYVKADSKTPFSLEFNGYIKNNATKSYQVNYLVFDTSIEKSNNSFNTQYCLQVPCASIIQNTLIQIPYSDIHKKWSDTPLFLDDNYLTIKRSNYCKNLEILHRFTMPSSLHGKTIKVTPRAGAEWQSEVIYSDYERDLLNSIYLIGDSIPPVISGIEEFGDLNQTVWSAKDADSGLREFYVIVTNQDNRGTRTFTATEDGLLNIDIDEEDTLFIGDFSMEFHAVDKVGNETIEYCGGRNLSVTAYIERILEPHTPIFRGGESGNLHIATKGYVDKVEIIFPEEFEMLSDKFNQVIEYPIPALYKEEIYKFMIPLYFPEGAFQVKIKAYKNEEVKECDVTFTTLGEEENVLNDIRTRLR